MKAENSSSTASTASQQQMCRAAVDASNWKLVEKAVVDKYAGLAGQFINTCKEKNWDLQQLQHYPSDEDRKILAELAEKYRECFEFLRKDMVKWEIKASYEMFISYACKNAQETYGRYMRTFIMLKGGSARKIFLDQEAMRGNLYGEIAAHVMYKAASRCKQAIAVITADYMQRPWCIRELLIFSSRLAANDQDLRLIPDFSPLTQRPKLNPNNMPLDISRWINLVKRVLPNQVDMRIGTHTDYDDEATHLNDLLSVITLPRLPSFNPVAEFTRKADEYREGTRTWLYNRIMEWYREEFDDPASTVFVLLGKAGIGKTVALAELCRAAGAIPAKKEKGAKTLKVLELDLVVAAMHLFRDDEIQTQDPVRVIKSISYQLEREVDGFAVQSRPGEDNTDLTLWFDQLIKRPALAVATEPKQSVVIVIDALDECAKVNRERLLKVVQKGWGQGELPKWLKLVVSSRDHDQIPFQLHVFEPTLLDVSLEENKADLRIYFDRWLRENGMPDNDIDDAIELLLKRSEGLFLYTRFLPSWLRRFKEKHGDSVLRKEMLIQEVPAKLDGFYKEYFKRIQTVFTSENRPYGRTLGPIVAARGPLPYETWMTLCGFDCHDQGSCDDFEQKILIHTQELLQKVDGSVRFLHQSMRDFLQNKRRAGPYLVVKPLKEAHRILANWCLQEENLSKPFALEHVLYHLVEAGRPAAELDALLCENYRWLSDAVEHSVRNASGELSNLWRDVQDYPGLSPDSTYVLSALKLSAHALRDVDYRQLPAQLYQRLHADHPLSAACLAEREHYNGLWPAGPPQSYLAAAESPLLHVFGDHSGAVKSVAFSQDGLKVVSASQDCTARVWSTESGREIQKFDGHSGWVYSVAFSQDGLKAVSGSFDRTVRVWSTESGREIKKFEGHSGWVYSVAFSQDGLKVVSGSQDCTARVWSTESGLEFQKFDGHSNWVYSVAFSAKGLKAVSGSSDKTVRVWCPESGREIKKFEGHASTVLSVAFSTDGLKVVSGSYDHTVRVWSTESGDEIHKFDRHSHGEVSSVAFSADGLKVVSGSDGVRICSTESGREIEKFDGHSGWVNSVAISQDGQKIVSGSDDHQVRVWSTESGREIPSSKMLGSVMSVALSQDGRKVVSGSTDMTVRVWSAESGREIHKLDGHSNTVTKVAFSPDGRKMVSGSYDNTVRVWCTKSGSEIHKLDGHSEVVGCVAFSPDGRKVVSGSADNTVRVWCTESGREIHKLVGHTEHVMSVAFSQDGMKIVSGSHDRTVRIWSTESWLATKIFDRHSGFVDSVAFSPCGGMVASGSADGTVRVWSTESGREILKLVENAHTDMSVVSSVAFSQDGRKVVSRSRDRNKSTVIVWCTESGREIQKFEGHSSSESSVLKAHPPNGSWPWVRIHKDDRTLQVSGIPFTFDRHVRSVRIRYNRETQSFVVFGTVREGLFLLHDSSEEIRQFRRETPRSCFSIAMTDVFDRKQGSFIGFCFFIAIGTLVLVAILLTVRFAI